MKVLSFSKGTFRRFFLVLVPSILLAFLLLVPSSPALGAPVWRIDSLANSTVAPGGTLDFFVKAVNVGDQPMDGSPITVTATLPNGMVAVSGSMVDRSTGVSHPCFDGRDGISPIAGASSVVCSTSHATPPPPSGNLEALNLTVRANSPAGVTLTTAFSVAGGGSASASTVDPTLVSSTPPAFGIDAFDGGTTDANGQPDTQAGDHPYAAGVSLDFNTLTNPIPILGEVWPVEVVKDVHTDLPPGLVGDPTAAAQCTLPELSNAKVGSSFETLPLCPPESQVGTTLVGLRGVQGGTASGNVVGPLPVFNLVPPPGVPAQFGFDVFGSVVVLNGTVRPGDYGISVNAVNIPEALAIVGTDVTLWGDPADPSHTPERACSGSDYPADGGPTCASHAPAKPFLRNPTVCTTPDRLATSVQADSWAHPGVFTPPVSFEPHESPGYPWPREDWGAPVGTSGCDAVPFAPSFQAAASSNEADSPSGLDVAVSMPQQGLSEPGKVSEADLKKVVVRLPEGVTVNPAAANGQGACSPAQVGLGSEAAPECPDDSKIGTVQLESPLLGKHDSEGEPLIDSGGHPVLETLNGSIYLATPFDNPFGSLLALYLVVEDAERGVVVKEAGHVFANEQTGQLETVFDNDPQLPFEHLRVKLFGGPNAPLRTPSACGEYATQASFAPWSGTTPVPASSPLKIEAGPEGAPCPANGLFAPRFAAGTQSPVAGHTSPFVLRLTREDTDQAFGSIDTSLPEGLTGYLKSVARCSDQALAAVSAAPGSGRTQEASPSCPAGSLLGGVTVKVGAGPDPFPVDSGRVYLAGAYQGAPFSLAIVTPAVAGPFDLGSVLVRAGIYVDPDTAKVTVKSGPLPTILQGILLDIRSLEVNVDRPGFILNPTSCDPMSIAAVVRSTQGVTANVSQRFQAAECRGLAFHPSFRVSTTGKTSKASGASLSVNVATHEGATNGGVRGESNIARVDVQLPVVLPARLPTLQKACTAAQFDTNPAGCPEDSFVGTAVAQTPILASALSGPAILVSHGGEAFPDLVVLLQGEGVQIDLTGHTQIKKGITYSHFETVPDAPVSSFDLTLPQGPHGVLTTDIPGRNLCTTTKTVLVTKRVTRRVNGHNRKVTVKAKKAVAAPLLMPTTITAQNGAVIHQNTKIAVTGCAKAKAVKHKIKQRRK
jgi:uncharacterized repeat protein (TIGR01451 family)